MQIPLFQCPVVQNSDYCAVEPPKQFGVSRWSDPTFEIGQDRAFMIALPIADVEGMKQR